MELEVISRLPHHPPIDPPLLFVHGAFAGAGVWERHFLPFFADRGFEAHALSLRGHGASAGRERLPWWSLADFVADLTQIVATLPEPPVLIGHSMGGMVIQKYLESGSAAGMVLMASTPPEGLLPSLWGMTVSHPLLLFQLSLIQRFGARFASLETMRQALFSEDTPDHQIKGYYSLLQGESMQASLDMLGLNPLRLTKQLSIPILVMGGARDVFFSAGLIKDVARAYGTQAVVFPELAHALMLEQNWRQPADCLLAWLNQHFPNTRTE